MACISSKSTATMVLALTLAACGRTDVVGGASGAGAGPTSASAGSIGAGVCGSTVATCPSDRCGAGTCAIVEIARLVRPEVFAADGRFVYAIDEAGERLVRVPRCGGRPETLALTTKPFGDPRLFGDTIYWHVGSTLGWMPKGGGTSRSVVLKPNGHLAQVISVQRVGSRVYVASSEGLLVLDLEGTEVADVHDSALGALAGDADGVYFDSSTPETGLYQLKPGASAPLRLTATHAWTSTAPTTNRAFVFFSDHPSSSDPFELLSFERATKVVSVLAELTDDPVRLAADDRCVYVEVRRSDTGGADDGLLRINPASSKPTVLGAQVQGFALDDDAYYFASGMEIFRKPK